MFSGPQCQPVRGLEIICPIRESNHGSLARSLVTMLSYPVPCINGSIVVTQHLHGYFTEIS
jgi:hypothetical protein